MNKDVYTNLKASDIEFGDGGNSINVNGADGGTIMRIKLTGQVNIIRDSKANRASILVNGDVDFYLE